jgi:1,4-alpha-glucan branching enzyme
MKFGAEIQDVGVHFRLWAPKMNQVSVVMNEGIPIPMISTGRGWHELVSAEAQAGTLYKFRLEQGGSEVPDPASRYQPSDVHGPSEVIDPDQYVWRDSDWRGRQWEECVI